MQDNANVIQISPKIRPIEGFCYGLRQTGIIVTLSFSRTMLNPSLSDWLNSNMERLLGNMRFVGSQSRYATTALLEHALHWTQQLLQQAQLPMPEQGIIISHTQQPHNDHYQIMLPCPLNQYHAPYKALKWLVELMSQPDKIDIEPLLAALRQFAPQSPITTYCLNAAHELGIPYVYLAGATLQFGQGIHARLLDKTLTDGLSMVGSQLAGNKQYAASVMHLAGIPTPPHFLVANEAQALQQAEVLGYPVVVKPVGQSKGKGVSSNLNNPAAVSKALAVAQRYPNPILIEKHIKGREFRLVTFQGKVIRVAEHIPAGVVGDGVHNIQALVTMANRDIRHSLPAHLRQADGSYVYATVNDLIANQELERGKGKLAPLVNLTLDEDVLALLTENNLTPDSIPPVDVFIPLRRAANVALGGLATTVALEQVHPDNLQLAVRAAALFRIDLAGIDLIIPEIHHSWLNGGAAICEVNSGPQMATHVYQQILQGLVKGNGCIPIIVVMGDDNTQTLSRQIQQALQDSGLNSGLVCRQGVWIGQQQIMGVTDAFAGSQALLLDTTVAAAVVCVEDDTLYQRGLPFSRFDWLVLVNKTTATANVPTMEQLLLRNVLLPACRGRVVVPHDATQYGWLKHFIPAERLWVAASEETPALLRNALTGLPLC